MDDSEDGPNEEITAIQNKLESGLSALIIECFSEDFQETPENIKYLLSSIAHLCGHLAARNGMAVSDLVGLVTHEVIEAQACVNSATLRGLMGPGPPPTEDPENPKDVN